MASIGGIRAEQERRKRFDLRAALDEIAQLQRAPLLRALRELETERLAVNDRARYWQDQANSARREACQLRAELAHVRRLLELSQAFLSESAKRRVSEVAVFTA